MVPVWSQEKVTTGVEKIVSKSCTQKKSLDCRHGGAAVSTRASQQKGLGFDSQTQ